MKAQALVPKGLDVGSHAEIPLHRGEALARLGDMPGAVSAFHQCITNIFC